MIKSRKKIRIAICTIGSFLSLIVSFYFSGVTRADAQGASLYLSPGSGTFFVGSTFDVSIFVNTGDQDINAVEVNLRFDPSRIQVASPTSGKSFIEVWVAQPSYSNTKGTMNFIGGIPTPGINTSSGLVSTVTFRAISPGTTSVYFLDSSKVLRNDAHGTDVLTSKNRGVYEIVIPPPEGPKVFSPTHPDQNKWYADNNPTFSWEKEEGVTGFSYDINQDSWGVPDNESEGEHTSISYSDLEDGLWYFHIKSEKNGVWGGTSHYLVHIDKTPPARFTPTVEPSETTTDKQPLVSFITTDALSGIDHYKIRYVDITEGREEEVGFLTEATSPYRMTPLKEGKYLIIVRAYDNTGNWQDGVVKVEILPEGFFISKFGIHFKGFVIPWWIIFLILLALLMIIIFRLIKKYREISKKEIQTIDREETESFSGMEKVLEDYRKRHDTQG